MEWRLLFFYGKEGRKHEEHPLDSHVSLSLGQMSGALLAGPSCQKTAQWLCVCVCARARALGDYVRASTSEAWVSRRAQHNVIERRLMFGRWSRKRLPEESCQTPSTLLLPFSRLLTLEIIKMKYRDATRKWSLSFDHWNVDRLFTSQILWIRGHLIRDINRISEEILCPLFWRCSGYFWPNLSVMDEKLGVLFLMSF